MKNPPIKIERALVALRVKRYVSKVPAKDHGTSLSARFAALFSRDDLSFSVSSIMVTIFSYLLDPAISFTLTISSPSSRAVPAYTYRRKFYVQ